MIQNLYIFFKCMLLSNLIFYNYMIRAEGNVATTLETIVVETTTELVTIITDIPQSDVEIALNHDVGKFTTMVFNYINSQYSNPQEHERCYDDYTKCLITQSAPSPVCTIQNVYYGHAIATYNSYCDAYFDNCLRKWRYWRIVDTGKCINIGSKFNIEKIRRHLK